MGRRDSIPAWILKYRDRIERGEITLEEILEEENKIRKKPIKLATVKRAVNALGFSVEGLRAIPPERAFEREKRGVAYGVETARTAGFAEEAEEAEKVMEEGEEAEEPMESWLTMEEMPAAAEEAAEEEGIKVAVPEAEMEGVAVERERERKEEGGEEEEEGKKRRREGAPAWILKYKEKIERGEITAEEILEEENKRREKPIKLSTVKRAINALGFSIGALKREEEEIDVREREVARRPAEEREERGAAVFHLSLSGETKRLFQDVKRRWEASLGKSLPDEYFLNILLVLARLAERGKTLVPRK
ncbi:MAG: hypothetical protein N2V74_06150 [Candidatus Methanospirare jalkutatii]|nr:MAG: hypothetical protein N2V74_06150 [Candidatus Methanospirare jalkutatii]